MSSRSPNPRRRRRHRRQARRGEADAAMPLPATRRRPPSSIACRRIRPPSRRLSCPAARSPSPRLPARSACSTKRASRRPTSPTLPTSSTAPRRPAVPSPFCSTADRARHPRGCSSATPDRGGSRSLAMLLFPPPRPICCRTPRPGSTSPISSSSIPSAPAIAASLRPETTCASGSSRSMATSVRSRW